MECTSLLRVPAPVAHGTVCGQTVQQAGGGEGSGVRGQGPGNGDEGPGVRGQRAAATKLAATYRSAEPFPHLRLTDFLEPDMLRAVLGEFPAADATTWISFRHFNENNAANHRVQPGRTAFTLVELVVTLAMVALAVSLVVPRLGGLIASTGLDAAQARVVDALAVARAVAAQRGSRLTVIYAPRTVRIMAAGEERSEPMSFPLPEGTRLTSVTTGDVRIDLAQKSVRIPFRSDGLCPDHAVVVASDENQKRKILAVEGLTGRITVQEAKHGQR